MERKKMRQTEPAPDTGGQVVRVAGKIKPQVNRYYGRVALRYRMLGGVLAVMLGLFLVLVLAVYGEYITYDNLTYLARDFDLSIQTGSGSFTTITYPRQESLSFVPFKNGMAVSGGDVLRIYDSAGIVLTEENLNYEEPVLVSSDKYVLAYDLGSRNYSLYNTLTRVIDRQADFRITCADVSDTGAFLLVTRSNETRYVVELYNTALNKTMSIYKDHYVLDAAIRDDGKRLVICSAIPSGTDFTCEISLCEDGKAEPVITKTYTGTMPLRASFAPDGSFAVLCDNEVLFFDKDGNEKNVYKITGMTLVSAHMNNGIAALVGAENALGSENRIVVLDFDGNVLFSQSYKERVTDICTAEEDGEYLCAILTTGSVIKLGTQGIVESVELEDDDTLSVECADQGVVVCTKDSMYYAFQ
ncbi:MAG: hypothetical protein IJ325_00445 [Clostridia bacterium]|nr:hypothetical protein [Clostridia bacterium]